MKYFDYNNESYYVEDQYQPYEIHQSHTSDGIHPLIYIEKTEPEYGFVFHKWKKERNQYLCVVPLGDNIDYMCDNLLQLNEEIEPDTNAIESAGTSHAEIYKFYNKKWRPIQKQKNGSDKYIDSHKENHIFRILKQE